MGRKKVISGAAHIMDALAEKIVSKYSSNKYEVQKMHFADKDGLLIQISNTKADVWGTAKTLLGCKTCASLLLIASGNDLQIEVVQGCWLDKGAAIAFGTFAAFGLLIVTGAFGIYRQYKLLDDIFHDAEFFAAYENQTVSRC